MEEPLEPQDTQTSPNQTPTTPVSSADKKNKVVKYVLIAVAVVLVILASWLIWSSANDNVEPQDTTSAQNSATQSEEEDTTAADNVGEGSADQSQEFLEITQWAVKAPTITTDGTLSYKLVDANTAHFRTKALDQISGSCTNNSVIVRRGTANEAAGLEPDDDTTFAEEYENREVSNSPNARAKVGDYYYLQGGSTASCSTVAQGQSGDISEQEDDITDSIIKALNQLQAL